MENKILKKVDLIFQECTVNDVIETVAKAVTKSPDDIILEIIDSGLKGRGGAGFPTGLKWKFTKNEDSPVKYVICNADEGDSGTFSDRMVMEGDPFVLIEGMTIAGLAVGATQGLHLSQSRISSCSQSIEYSY